MDRVVLVGVVALLGLAPAAWLWTGQLWRCERIAIYAVCMAALGWRYAYDRRQHRNHPVLVPLPLGLALAGYAFIATGAAAEFSIVSRYERVDRDLLGKVAEVVVPMLRLTALVLLGVSLVDVATDGAAALGARSRRLARIPRWLRSREAVYVVLACGITALACSEFRRRDATPLAISSTLALAFSLLFCRTLWADGQGVAARWLPHLGVWTSAAMAACGRGGVVRSNGVDVLRDAALNATWIGAVYWMSLKLRRRVVDQQAPTAGTEVAAGTDFYCDVHGHAQHVLQTIERTDAGVLGFTGLRGVGKSSLSRWVLRELRSRHFTLQVTSPARHDADLGFFVSVCRAVAQRVRDDLHPSFDPPPGVTRVLVRKHGAAALVLLAALGAAAWGMTATTRSASGIPDKSQRMNLDAGAFEWERAMVEQLRSQMQMALRHESEHPALSDRRHLVVPSTDRESTLPGFAVLPAAASGDARGFLAARLSGRRIEPQLTLYEDDVERTYRDSPANPFEPDRMTASMAFYSSAIAARVLAPDSLCQRTLPALHVLRCAAFESAGLVGTVQKAFRTRPPTPKSPPTPVTVSFSRAQLIELDELLRLYVSALPDPVGGEAVLPLLAGDENPLIAALGVPALSLRFRLPDDVWRLAFWVSITLAGTLVLTSVAYARAANLLRAIVNRRDLLLYQEASTFLEELSFTTSSESSHGLSWQGLAVGAKRMLAARAMTLPGLTARYQHFVERVCEHYNGKLVIAIDELDKVHDMAQVQGLLAEIKGALSVPGTYYLISIAEDAATAFRHRLSSGRDIFESTFDEIIDVPRMGLAQAEAMLEERVRRGAFGSAPLPRELLWVPVMFGAGIPREILRNYRMLHLLQPKTSADAVEHLMKAESSDWIAHLSQSKLAGAELVAVCAHALRASVAIEERAFATAYAELTECLGVIDPDDVRARARSAELVGADQAEAQLAARTYLALAHDIQSCLRLQVMVSVAELLQTRADVHHFGPIVLDLLAVSSKKPTLAETLLEQLRTDQKLAPASRARSLAPAQARH